MDSRIAKFLLAKSSDISPQVKITHEKLSLELGTNRVVVSRILEAFAAEQSIKLTRGCITLLDKTKLQNK